MSNEPTVKPWTGLMRVRYYGFLAYRCRRQRLAQICQALMVAERHLKPLRRPATRFPTAPARTAGDRHCASPGFLRPSDPSSAGHPATGDSAFEHEVAPGTPRS